MKGDIKIRFDINNPGRDRPHFQIEKRVKNIRKDDWEDLGSDHRYYSEGNKK